MDLEISQPRVGMWFRAGNGLALILGLILAGMGPAVGWAQTPFDALLRDLRSEGPVTDQAGVLNPVERAQLQRLSQELQAKTSVEMAVVTIRSLEGGEINDFANRLFEKWGIGKKGKDNGILFLAAIQDRKLRVEVGYGLESVLNDARVGRLLDERVVPYFKREQMGTGLVQGSLAIAEAVARDAGVQLSMGPSTPPRSRRRGPLGGVLPLLVLVALVFVFRRNPFLALLLAGSARRHNRHGGYFGGGGFGGSGGFGGGGFGGFGGGSSGGGGASRSW